MTNPDPFARTLDFVYQPIKNPDDTTTGVFVVGVDMTERRRLAIHSRRGGLDASVPGSIEGEVIEECHAIGLGPHADLART